MNPLCVIRSTASRSRPSRVIGGKLFLKVFLSALLICLAGICCGCSDLQAKHAMATRMQADAVAASVIISQGQALGADRARPYVGEAAAILGGYYQSATINVLAYWFDASKEILASPAIYNGLRAAALSAKDSASRASLTATSQPYTDADVIQDAQFQARSIRAVDNLRKAVK